MIKPGIYDEQYDIDTDYLKICTIRGFRALANARYYFYDKSNKVYDQSTFNAYLYLLDAFYFFEKGNISIGIKAEDYRKGLKRPIYTD